MEYVHASFKYTVPASCRASTDFPSAACAVCTRPQRDLLTPITQPISPSAGPKISFLDCPLDLTTLFWNPSIPAPMAPI